LEGSETDRLAAFDVATRDRLIRSGALPGDIMYFVSRLIRGINADPSMSAGEREGHIQRLCDSYQLDIERRPAGIGTEEYTLTPRSVH